jgi:CubicO group peptidase (beta-lactamase class C family)
LLRKSMAVPTGLDFNDRRSLEIELPAGNGVGTARAVACAYSALAEGGGQLGITRETMHLLTELPPQVQEDDRVLGLPAYYSLGYSRPGPTTSFGSTPRAFGTPGAGGSIGMADPDARLGYAYVTNKFDFYLFDDPREKAVRAALYNAIARMESRAATGLSANEIDEIVATTT